METLYKYYRKKGRSWKS